MQSEFQTVGAPMPTATVLAQPTLPPTDVSASGLRVALPNGLSGFVAGGFTAFVCTVAVLTYDDLPVSVPIDWAVTGKQAIAPVPSFPARFERAWAEMSSYRNLQAGWDGPHSRAPNFGVVESALSFLQALPDDLPAPEPTVSEDGVVGWFWKTQRAIAVVEFPEKSRLTYYATAVESSVEARGAHEFDKRSIPQDFLDIVRAA